MNRKTGTEGQEDRDRAQIDMFQEVNRVGHPSICAMACSSLPECSWGDRPGG